MLHRIFFPCAVAGLFGILAGCDGGSPESKGGNDPGGSGKAAEVAFIEVQPEPLQATNILPGRVVAFEVAEIRPQVGGIIQSRLFEEGGHVDEGQQLYQIDPALYRAELSLARANLQDAKARLGNAKRVEQRFQKLFNENAVSEQQLEDATFALDRAEAAVSRAEAEVELAEINLAYTEVRSPISGFIGPSRVTKGALVTAGQELPLAVVRELDPVYVDLVQPAAETLKLRKRLTTVQKEEDEDRLKVTLYLENDQDPYPHPGTLDATEPAVDLRTGTVRLRSVFPNPDRTLLPGMFVRASIEGTEQPESILVPQKSVRIGAGGEKTAWVIGPNDQAQRRSLTVEGMDGNRWIVSEGLEPGDRLIVEGTMGLREGAPVSPSKVGEKDG